MNVSLPNLSTLCLLLIPLAGEGATTLHVGKGGCSNSGDPYYCKIGDAIAAAAAGDTVVIAEGTYAENLTIDRDLTLQGNASGTQLTTGGANASIITVIAAATIKDLTVAGGEVTGSGGGITVAFGAKLTLENATVQANSARMHGGGIASRGTLKISRSTITENSAGQNGGGVMSTGTFALDRSTVSFNSAQRGGGLAVVEGVITQANINENAADYGGGLSGGKLTLSASRVSANAAIDGAGIYVQSALTLTDSTIDDNRASRKGGGIFNDGKATITGSSLIANAAEAAGGGVYDDNTLAMHATTVSGNSASQGGGLFGGGVSTLVGVTVADNSGQGGGIYAGGAVTMAHTLVARNTGDAQPDCHNVTSHGYNLVADNRGCIANAAVGDRLDIGAEAAQLGPLADNGGATKSHELLLGSHAIDAGGTGCLPTDQRGVARPYDGDRSGTAECDIGAYELRNEILVDAGALLTTTEAGGTATFTVVLTSVPTAAVAVGVASNDTGEGSVSPASLTFTPEDWNIPQTAVVIGVPDRMMDGDAHYAILFTPSNSADPRYDHLTPAALTAVNLDNDTIGVNAAAVPLVTSETGGSASFTVSLLRAPTATVTIDLATSDPAEAKTEPAALTLAAGAQGPVTVTVTGVDDGKRDGDKRYTITGRARSADPYFNGAEPPAVAATNVDDGAVILEKSGDDTAEEENGGGGVTD